MHRQIGGEIPASEVETMPSESLSHKSIFRLWITRKSCSVLGSFTSKLYLSTKRIVPMLSTGPMTHHVGEDGVEL